MNLRFNSFGSFIENSDFFVLPVKNTVLSAGHMAMLEAMSLGKIILTTDVPSIRDYVNEDIVFFYDPENVQDLGKMIEYLSESYQSPQMLEKSAFAKKTYEQDFTFKALLSRIVRESLNNK